jgi:hypothetical protein
MRFSFKTQHITGQNHAWRSSSRRSWKTPWQGRSFCWSGNDTFSRDWKKIILP